MKWEKKGSRWYSDNGDYMISTLPQYGISQDYFAVHLNVGGCWIPASTASGKRRVYRRTFKAAEKFCEEKANA